MIRFPVGVLLVAAVACGGDATPTSPSSASAAPFSSLDLVDGTGAEATAGARLTVDYTGWLYDAEQPEQQGRQFDTTAGRQPFTFTLGAGDVIRGWDLGVVGMKVGGTRRLIVPPELAYGVSGVRGVIPPNATLVFDIELLNVQR